MEVFPKITVVMPNFNQVKFLERALLSIIQQNYPNIELIVIDGGSTDGSLDVIKKYHSKIAYWLSEKDEGMYHAINKGFEKSTGEIMCWLNSDDILWKNSLMHVAKIFSNNPKIEWLQGFPTVIDEEDNMVFKREPVCSKFYFFLKLYEKTFSFIQQESTFWKRGLWNKAGGRINTKYKLAGDFDLWIRFFKITKLYCSQKYLGAFRKRTGQLSSNKELYLMEADKSINENTSQLSIANRIMLKVVLKLNEINNKFSKRLFKMLSQNLIGKPIYID